MADDRTRETQDPGEPLPPEAAAVLAQWATADPPAGFVDRVIAAAQQQPARRARRRARLLAIAVAALVATAGSLVLLARGTPSDNGARVVRERETIRLG